MENEVTASELILITSAVNILAEVCAAPNTKIIEWLTGKLWDQDEAKSLIEFIEG